MIQLTRLNGEVFALNAALVYRIEQHKDTIVFLTDGNDFIVREPLVEVVDRIRRAQAQVLADAITLSTMYDPDAGEPAGDAGDAGPGPDGGSAADPADADAEGATADGAAGGGER